MKRLSYANVVATLALFLALGGGAVWAAGKIGSGEIKRNAIKSRHLAAGAVHTADIAGNALAPNATSVGGVKVTPVKASLQTSLPAVTLLQVGTTKVLFSCGASTAGLNTTQADGNSPTAYVQYVRGPDSVVAALLTGGPSNWSSDVGAQTANITIRQTSGKVTRLLVSTYYSLNETGDNDCFADGTIETF